MCYVGSFDSWGGGPFATLRYAMYLLQVPERLYWTLRRRRDVERAVRVYRFSGLICQGGQYVTEEGRNSAFEFTA